jgi:hypothetical protein
MNYWVVLFLNFLPMLILYLIATYSPEVAVISHTILGKTIAVALILIYVYMDTISGLLVCALVIFYYQTDYVEAFHSDNMILHQLSPPKEVNGLGRLLSASSMPKDVEKVGSPEKEKVDYDSMELEKAYPLEPQINAVYDKDSSDFRKKNCKKGSLLHKNEKVKPEMAEHVFPSLEMDDFKKCNVCDPACEFDMIDSRIKDEENLIKPRL